MIYYVYILKCRDGTFYTGYTNNISRRIEKHNAGVGAKYTRARLPVKLVYVEEYPTKGEAMKREYQIKQMSREQKLIHILTYKHRDIISKLS